MLHNFLWQSKGSIISIGMSKFKSVFAIFCVLTFLVFNSGCSKENDNIDFGEHTELTQGEDIPEITQGTNSPDEIIYGDPVIGGNAILAQDTLDDLTASLIIRDISHLPDDTENGDYYGGRLIVVHLKDNKSGAVVENILPRTSYTFGSLYSGFEDDRLMVIDAKCAADSVKLFCIEDNGKKDYILKAEYIRYNNGEYISAFACCDMSRYSGENAYLKWYTGGTPDFYLTHDFAYKSDNVFLDSRAETEYEFDTENLKVTKRNMDPADIVFGEPEIGKNSILSQDTLGEYSAVVEIHNILSIPEDNDNEYYGKAYQGERIFIKVTVNDSIFAYSSLRNAHLLYQFNSDIPEKCTGEGATHIFQVEQNGETHYILMQYTMYSKETDIIEAKFACLDTEFYDQYKDSPNEVLHDLFWFSEKFVGMSTDEFEIGIPVSRSFEYVGDGVFKDSVYGYELTFDFEKMSAKAQSVQ